VAPNLHPRFRWRGRGPFLRERGGNPRRKTNKQETPRSRGLKTTHGLRWQYIHCQAPEASLALAQTGVPQPATSYVFAALAGRAPTSGPGQKGSAHAFRRAERAVAGQDLDQRAVITELLRAPIGMGVELERADRAGVHRFLLHGAGRIANPPVSRSKSALK